MFTVVEREHLLGVLTARARDDDGVASAALVGSAARGTQDEWSDIDLVLGLADGSDPSMVAQRWTEVMYDEHHAVHHLDVRAQGVLYRVFLLASTLQVDISFWPGDTFRATEPGFRLIFGEPNAPSEPPPPDVEAGVGWAWLYALHARSAIERHRPWQAQMMLDGLRERVLTLACVRRGLNPHHGRQVDLLPAEDLHAVDAAGPRDRSSSEQRRSLSALGALLMQEAAAYDRDLADRIAAPLGRLG